MTQPAGAGEPRATILISTKNRRDELCRAVASALTQTVPVEVLVIDDGSTDGTSEMIRAEFPSVRLDRAEPSRGYIVQRNRGAAMAAAPVVISIDDDAVFESARTVEQTLAEMDSPGGRVGAVAIPYIDVLINPAVRQRAPGESGIYVANEFRGTAHALRRDLFLAIGGYREVLTHQTEEGDYAIRMLAAGYVTRLGRADPIHHMESPRRDLTRQIVFNARNNLLFAWHNAPALWLLPHLGFTSANLLRHGVRTGYVRGSLRGIGRAYGDMATGRVKRQPVPRAVYELYRWMKKRGAARLEEIEGRLPPMKMVAPAGARA